jgi:hypothetical protein
MGKLDNKGFGSITLYMALAIIVMSLVSFFWIKALKAEIKFYKAENVRFATDNETLTKAKEKQFAADKKALEACQDAETGCLNRLAQCSEPLIINGCPEIAKVTGKEDPVRKETEAIGWEVKQ